MEQFSGSRRDAESQPPKYTTILLPDMFQSFIRHSPRINPHYESVKKESEAWLNEFCAFGPKMQMKINKCDFSYFCAISAPDAPRDKFRTLCDWGNWVFPYDDMFDNGHLRDQPQESRRVMESLMAPMLNKELEENRLRIVQVHDSVVKRVSEVSPQGVQQRFAKAMQAYCNGALAHVNDHSSHRIPDLEEMVLTRRESAGVSPLYHLVEYAHDIHLPDEIFESPILKELEVLGMDMVSISNDMLSYAKEESECVPHNMVSACRMGGMSAQQAFDTVGSLLEGRYRRWDIAEERLPTWGEPLDKMVAQYVHGIKCVVQANISWSFRSERYLGPQPELVRITRKMDVMVSPPYLVQAISENAQTSALSHVYYLFFLAISALLRFWNGLIRRGAVSKSVEYHKKQHN